MTKLRLPVDPETLPYRPCVGIVLFHPNGKVWAGRRIALANSEYDGSPQLWQFPQGGIDDGEDPERAARRELHEETGVHSVEPLAATDDWLTYDLPTSLVGIGLKGRFRGQKQRWFAYRFTGKDGQIAIDPPPPNADGTPNKAEFDAWEWTTLADMPARVVPFKRDLYREIARRFEHLAV